MQVIRLAKVKSFRRLDCSPSFLIVNGGTHAEREGLPHSPTPLWGNVPRTRERVLAAGTRARRRARERERASERGLFERERSAREPLCSHVGWKASRVCRAETTGRYKWSSAKERKMHSATGSHRSRTRSLSSR